MREVQPEEILPAMKAAGITYVEHHDCGLCGYMTNYQLVDDRLYFDPGCGCSVRPASLEPRSWISVSDWINMQYNDTKRELAAKFGITLT